MPHPALRSARDFVRQNISDEGRHAGDAVYYTPLNTEPLNNVSFGNGLSSPPKKAEKFVLTPKLCHAVNPDRSTYMQVWDVIMMTAFIEVTVQVPYQIAFTKPSFGTVFWSNRGFDLIFFMDMIMRFFVGYFDEIQGRLVTDFSKIASKYLRGWFLIDAVSIMPWDWFSLVFPDTSCHWRILRLLRILRILRFTHGARILARLQVNVGIPFTHFTVMQNISLMMVGCHWSACLWGWVAMRERHDGVPKGEKNWLAVVAEAKGGEIYYTEPWEIYWVALYWAVMTMTGVGYGDIVPQNQFEYKISVIVMVSVALVWAFVVGNIVTVLATLNPHETHFKQSMDDLNLLLADWSVPYSLRVQLRSYFVQAKQLNHYLEQKKLMDTVSPILHAAVAMHMHEAWIDNVIFFKKLHRVEIIAIVRRLSAFMYAPNEEIPGHRALFIVWRGVCSRRGKVHIKNHVWGVDMILDNERLRSNDHARAIGYCEMLVLDYVDLVEFASRSMELQMELRRAKKYIAFQRGMVLIKRVFSKIYDNGILDRTTITNNERLAVAEYILQGHVTEDVAENRGELTRVQSIAHLDTDDATSEAKCDYIVIVPGLSVNENVHRSSHRVVVLEKGTKVTVLEFAETPDEGWMRARIKSPAGWISVWDEDRQIQMVEEAEADSKSEDAPMLHERSQSLEVRDPALTEGLLDTPGFTHWEANAKVSPNVKAMAQDLLEQMLAQAYADGKNAASSLNAGSLPTNLSTMTMLSNTQRSERRQRSGQRMSQVMQNVREVLPGSFTPPSMRIHRLGSFGQQVGAAMRSRSPFPFGR